MVPPLNRTQLENLLADELGDLLHSENMLIKALPKLAAAAGTQELKEFFEKDLVQTRKQVKQVEKMLGELEREAREKKCEGMMGLLVECQHLVTRSKPSITADQALICAARKIKAFEKTAYESVTAWAQLCGHTRLAEIGAALASEEESATELLREMQQRFVEQEETALAIV
jgi:ferritin-like metal-binding protein YciE